MAAEYVTAEGQYSARATTIFLVVKGLRRFGGLPRSHKEYTTLEIADLLQEGLPWRIALSMKERNLVSEDLLADFLSISVRTLQRSRLTPQKRMSRDVSENTARLAMVLEAAIDLFDGSEKKAREWLISRQRGLGNRIPLAVAATEIGATEVLNLIGRISWGVIS